MQHVKVERREAVAHPRRLARAQGRHLVVFLACLPRVVRPVSDQGQDSRAHVESPALQDTLARGSVKQRPPALVGTSWRAIGTGFTSPPGTAVLGSAAMAADPGAA